MHAENSAGLATGTAGQMDGMELRVCAQLGKSKHHQATLLLLTPRTRPPAIISKDSQTALSLVEAESDYASIRESDLFSKPQC